MTNGDTVNDRADNLPISENDLKLLLRSLDKQKMVKAMLYLVLNTGIAPKDMLAVKLKDFDSAQSEIRVYDIWLARSRAVKLNYSVLRAITDYMDGRYKEEERLFDISEQTAITKLYELSQGRIGRPVSWIAIRRTWAVLCFKNGIGLKDMIESSGATAQQLAVWSLWDKSNGGKKEPLDLLANLLK